MCERLPGLGVDDENRRYFKIEERPCTKGLNTRFYLDHGSWSRTWCSRHPVMRVDSLSVLFTRAFRQVSLKVSDTVLVRIDLRAN